jgi:hypothetical protein
MSGFAVVRLFSDHGLHRWGDLGNPSLELSFTCCLLAPALLDLLLDFSALLVVNLSSLAHLDLRDTP